MTGAYCCGAGAGAYCCGVGVTLLGAVAVAVRLIVLGAGGTLGAERTVTGAAGRRGGKLGAVRPEAG